MTDKYHGTPLYPISTLNTLRGFNFVVPFIRADNVRRLLEGGLAAKVMLDSGAYSAWRRGVLINWDKYYAWTERWLRYGNAWAVIGDVIDGTEEDNDRLIEEWPHGERGAPVWHMHESFSKLCGLVQKWPRVCIGSSGQFATVGTPEWRARMDAAMDYIALPDGSMPTKLHMLRGLRLVRPGWPYPFDSVDSASAARNQASQKCSTLETLQQWEVLHCPTHWGI